MKGFLIGNQCEQFLPGRNGGGKSSRDDATGKMNEKCDSESSPVSLLRICGNEKDDTYSDKFYDVSEYLLWGVNEIDASNS